MPEFGKLDKNSNLIDFLTCHTKCRQMLFVFNSFVDNFFFFDIVTNNSIGVLREIPTEFSKERIRSTNILKLDTSNVFERPSSLSWGIKGLLFTSYNSHLSRCIVLERWQCDKSWILTQFLISDSVSSKNTDYYNFQLFRRSNPSPIYDVNLNLIQAFGWLEYL